MARVESTGDKNTGPGPQGAAFSRRGMIRGAAAVAATLPALARSGAAVAAPPSGGPAEMTASLTDAIYINANENPYGPCPAAARALAGLTTLSGRYGMAFADKLGALFAEQNGLKPECVSLHPGSYVPLRAAALAWSSVERPIAYAEPTFDSGFFGADRKPLTAAVTIPVGKDHAPDVRALLAAAPNAGVYYLCNPNNPTGTVTSRADIEWLLTNKPEGSLLLMDEAYIHYSDAVSCLDLVAKGADVLVLRTFSKIYGLAGLRIGLIAGRPDLLAPLDRYANNIVPMPAAVAAEASLLDAAVVPARKAEADRIKASLYAWFTARGVKHVPSAGNFMMVHVGKPGGEVQKALAAHRVMISGPRKHMDDWVRISIGTPAEMESFKAAFAKVMGLA